MSFLKLLSGFVPGWIPGYYSQPFINHIQMFDMRDFTHEHEVPYVLRHMCKIIKNRSFESLFLFFAWQVFLRASYPSLLLCNSGNYYQDFPQYDLPFDYHNYYSGSPLYASALCARVARARAVGHLWRAGARPRLGRIVRLNCNKLKK